MNTLVESLCEQITSVNIVLESIFVLIVVSFDQHGEQKNEFHAKNYVQFTIMASVKFEIIFTTLVSTSFLCLNLNKLSGVQEKTVVS